MRSNSRIAGSDSGAAFGCVATFWEGRLSQRMWYRFNGRSRALRYQRRRFGRASTCRAEHLPARRARPRRRVTPRPLRASDALWKPCVPFSYRPWSPLVRIRLPCGADREPGGDGKVDTVLNSRRHSGRDRRLERTRAVAKVEATEISRLGFTVRRTRHQGVPTSIARPYYE
jgi:hypothetical protein